jgi:hypothetical protein
MPQLAYWNGWGSSVMERLNMRKTGRSGNGFGRERLPLRIESTPRLKLKALGATRKLIVESQIADIFDFHFAVFD